MNSHWGVLKTADTEGSIVGGENSDGGSEGIEGGILVYVNDVIGTAVSEADGLLAGTVPTITSVGLNLDVFGDQNEGAVFETNGGAWAVLEGVVGPTDENIILIGQFTTQGQFDFRMNIQIGIPVELQCSHPDCHTTIQYVAELHPLDAEPGVENDNKFVFDGLTFTSEPLACDFDSSIDELSSNIEFSAYPNPTTGLVSLTVDQKVAQSIELQVFDAIGQLIKTINYGSVGTRFNAEVDLSAYPAGAYTLVVKTDNGVVPTRIVKH